MIRFRIGQSWKKESAATPSDSIGLEFEGVDVFQGVTEEPLTQAVPDLIEALNALAVEGHRTAQTSFTEAHLELAFHRVDSEGQVDLYIVSMGRPARLLRKPVRMDLGELVEAGIRCSRSLSRDLTSARTRGA